VTKNKIIGGADYVIYRTMIAVKWCFVTFGGQKQMWGSCNHVVRTWWNRAFNW